MSDLQCPARLYVAWPVSPDVDPDVLAPAGDPVVSVHRLVDDTGEWLLDIADLHRGEAVLVLVDRPPRQLPDLAPGDRVDLEVDWDGVRRV